MGESEVDARCRHANVSQQTPVGDSRERVGRASTMSENTYKSQGVQKARVTKVLESGEPVVI